MYAINSAVPCGTGFILLILPRTDVLGYIHAVRSGLLRAPGEISGLTADGPRRMLQVLSKLTAPKTYLDQSAIVRTSSSGR
jgi:hypothetical protein